jgi:hypothetical protein
MLIMYILTNLYTICFRINRAIFFIICGLLCSCEQEVNLNLPVEAPFRTINCILNPDSLIKAYITDSQSITDSTGFKIRDNDTVIVYENSVALDTMALSNEGYYFSNFKPKEGFDYTIETRNKSKCQGTDSVPLKCKIDTFRLIKTNNNNYYFRLVFQNPETKDNYLILRALKNDSFGKWIPNVYTLLTPVTGIEMTNNGVILNNKQFDNKIVTLDFSVYTTQSGFLTVEVQHISHSLYWYYITLIQNYFANTDGGYQRVKMFNNINNGLGIVGASAITRDSIKLK